MFDADDRYDARVAQVIAGDPGDPVPEEALGRPLERDPVADAIGATRLRNVADGRVAVAVAQLLRTTSPRECLSARTLVAAEIGPALALGSGAATKLVDAVIALTTRLHATFAAVVDGALAWDKAVALAQWTAPLSDEQARVVEDRLLPQASQRTPAQHNDALRRAVTQVDPDGADQRRRRAKADVALIRSHYGDGMGELFARMASEQLDTVWTAADLWARSRKAEGDARALDGLRVAALVQWAQSFLHHGDPTYCDRWCAPGSHGAADSQPTAPHRAAPARRGRPGALHALWDLCSLLGLAHNCGELSDSAAVLPPEAMRELVAGGVRLRRMLVDDTTGELVDLTPSQWCLARTATTELDAPVVLSVIVTVATWRAVVDATAAPDLLEALGRAPRAVQEMAPRRAPTTSWTPCPLRIRSRHG